MAVHSTYVGRQKRPAYITLMLTPGGSRPEPGLWLVEVGVGIKPDFHSYGVPQGGACNLFRRVAFHYSIRLLDSMQLYIQIFQGKSSTPNRQHGHIIRY